MNLANRNFRILLACQVQREAARLCDAPKAKQFIKDGVAEWAMFEALHTIERVETPYGPCTAFLDNLYGNDRDVEALVLSLCLTAAILQS
jgi:hypothetical protein